MILVGDVIEQLKTLPDQSVQCVVTSPPYWGLRDYGVDGQIGLEPTIDEYVAKMVEVFGEVRRVLRDDGTLWMNLGDAYAGSRGDRAAAVNDPNWKRGGHIDYKRRRPTDRGHGLKNKDLIGMPWRVAFALQADDWYLRSDIIWSRTNSMPESVSDRPAKAHEYIFLLSKQPQYYYDSEAIKTLGSRRTVWDIPVLRIKEAHFATFPERLAQLCLLAGSSRKGCCSKCGLSWARVILSTGHINKREPAHVPGNTATKTDSTGWRPTTIATDDWKVMCDCEAEIVPCIVLDPFLGSGTTGLVAQNEGRDWIGIELNEEYAEIARKRTMHVQESFL